MQEGGTFCETPLPSPSLGPRSCELVHNHLLVDSENILANDLIYCLFDC